MKKIIIAALFIVTGSPLLGVYFQVTNKKGVPITVTFKNATVTNTDWADDSAHTDEGIVYFHEVAEQTVAGPTLIANNSTANFSISNENQNPLLVNFLGGIYNPVELYKYFVIIQWNNDVEHTENRGLIDFFNVPHFTPRYIVKNDASVVLSDQSNEEMSDIMHPEAEPEEIEEAVPVELFQEPHEFAGFAEPGEEILAAPALAVPEEEIKVVPQEDEPLAAPSAPFNIYNS